MKPEETRAFRKRHGLTQAGLAERLGLPNPAKGGKVTVARRVGGKRAPIPFLRRALDDLERELGEARGREPG